MNTQTKPQELASIRRGSYEFQSVRALISAGSVPRNEKDAEISAKEEVLRIQRVYDRRDYPVQTGIGPRALEARASSSRS